MTSSRKGVLAAVVLFFLIAVTVLGSMAWATAATYRLAEKNVVDAHESRVQAAMRRMEADIQGVLNSESSRTYKDYLDRYRENPDLIINDGIRLNPEDTIIEVASPLAQSDPPYEWMDLHFHISPDGSLNSPQIPDRSVWFYENSGFSPEYSRRARVAWKSLEKLFHVTDFRQRVADVFRHLHPDDVVEAERVALVKQTAETKAAESRGVDRARSLSKSQERYLPPGACLHPELAIQNLDSPPPIVTHEEGWSELDGDFIAIKPGTFAPAFWVEPEPAEPSKLAFVREMYADADVYYQGFIADWKSLKTQLLEKVCEVYPKAELRPVRNDAQLSPEELSRKLTYLPVVLEVPGIPADAAWKSIGWQLAVVWATGAAVLVIAGAGVRNLVALTQRRMQFAYAVTHELRTPLTTFRLYSDMLSAGLVPRESQQEYLDTLNRESVRLSKLVEEVLEYARLENQNVRLNVTNTDAPSLLRLVSEPLERLCGQNGVDGRTFNNVANGQVIRTDVNLVSQIAGVLVNNACRHARDASRPTVVMTLGTEGDRVYLDVIDSGPGIARADARKIFRPFRRGKDADRSARGGIGLGLALARNWASLLGGRLDLIARHHPQYSGAHFRLTIPTQPAA